MVVERRRVGARSAVDAWYLDRASPSW